MKRVRCTRVLKVDQKMLQSRPFNRLYNLGIDTLLVLRFDPRS